LSLALVALAAGPAAAKVVKAQPRCVALNATLTSSGLDAAGLTLCFEAGTCLRLDLATRAWSATDAAPPTASAPPTPTSKTTFSTTLHVCDLAGKDCHDVPAPSVAGLGDDDVVASADGSLVAVISPPRPTKLGGSERPIFLYDAPTGRLITTIHPWKTGMGDPFFFRGARFLGETLFVAIAQSPVSSSGRLYAGRTGKRLADVGGKDRDLDDLPATDLDLGGGRWAFPTFDSNELVVHDVKTGRRLPSIALGGARDKPIGPGLPLLQKTADGRALIAVRGGPVPEVTVVELATRKASFHQVPLCK
jgi:hypothetical protein